MSAANLGTKRQCPKCGAKFYDFGASDPVTCPKCSNSWKESATPKKAKAKKEKPAAAPKKAAPKIVIPPEFEAALPPDMPEADDAGELDELEPVEEEEVEMTSLEEVEEHEEEKVDPDSDDAEDEMFTEIEGEPKLVDDLADYIETDEDHDDENEEE